MPFLQTNDINICYESHGTGDPLVLISGLGYDQWMWHKMAPGLAEQFQVITFDNRGAGQTDKPAGPYTAQLLAADTVALLAALKIPQAIIMGHSMGGFIAQALALDHPDRVAKLILSATNFGGPNHIPVTQEALVVLMDTTSDPITRLRKGIEISCAPGYVAANQAFVQEWLDYRVQHPIDPTGYQAQLAIGLSLMSAEASFEQRLKEVAAPTLILSGEHDKVVPPANAALLADEIPHSEVMILSGAGHFFPFEVPDTANEAIISFATAK